MTESMRTKVAATEAVAETVQVLAAIVTVSIANKAKAVRRAVATLANKEVKAMARIENSTYKEMDDYPPILQARHVQELLILTSTIINSNFPL